MALEDLKFEEADFVGEDVASLPDRVAAQAAFVKARMDNVGKNLIALGRFNDLIDALLAVANGASGADGIGCTPIAALGSAATAQAMFEALIGNIVNNLTAGGTTKFLSAEQGKTLQTNKVAKDDTTNVYMDARNDATITLAAGTPLVLSYPTVDANSAITYNGSTKMFTVVKQGWYLVSVMMQLANSADNYLNIVNSGEGRQYINRNPGFQYNNISAILSLEAGQSFYIYGQSSVANTIAAGNTKIRVAKLR